MALDQTDRSILALIPAFEEGPRIAPVVTGALAHLPVVVVDDGSSDDTAAAAEAAGAMVLRQRPNAGKGAALRAGFRYALDGGAAAVITLDADGQHDPGEIPYNTIGGVALAVALGRGVPDNQSGYRLIGRTLMRALLESDESGFEFEVEMIARCIALGLPMSSVPIRTIYAGQPSHIRPVKHLTEFVRVTRKARRIARGDG